MGFPENYEVGYLPLTVTDVKGRKELVLSDRDPEAPTFAGQTLRWTPQEKHVGRHFIRLFGRDAETSGRSYPNGWWWELNVERVSASIPFYVDGISIGPSGNEFLAWGKELPSEAPMLATVDISTGKITSQHMPSEPVLVGAMDDTCCYVCCGVRAPATGLSRPPEKLPATMQVLKRDTYELVGQTTFDTQPLRIVSLAGKELVVISRDSTVRCALPDLTISPITSEVFPFGEYHDGWLVDGVVWDREMKPSLLLMPHQFGASLRTVMSQPGAHSIQFNEPGDAIAPSLGGYPAARLTKPNSDWTTQLPGALLFDYAAGVLPKLNNGRVELQTRTESSRELRRYAVCRSGGAAQLGEGKVVVGPGVVLVNYAGKVYAVATADLCPNESLFRFETRQSTLTLDYRNTNAVEYSAPGATQYELTLFSSDSDASREMCLHLTSTSGNFTVDLKNSSNWLSYARTRLGVRGANAAKHWREQVSDEFARLVGRPPTGVPVPVYAAVLARRADGERAVLFHVYLVEIPPEDF